MTSFQLEYTWRDTGSPVGHCIRSRAKQEGKLAIFSCGKVVESLCMLQMVNRGVVGFDTTVVSLSTKERKVTLRDCLQHRGGKSHISTPFSSLEEANRIIRAPTPGELLCWLELQDTDPQTETSAYHAVTRGILLDLVAREMETRSISELVRDLKLYLEIPDEEMSFGQDKNKVCRVRAKEWATTFLLKTWLGVGVTPNLRRGILNLLSNKDQVRQVFTPVGDITADVVKIANTNALGSLPLTSMNMYATATAMTKVLHEFILALEGVEPESAKAPVFDTVLQDTFTFTAYGLAQDYFRPGWIGWAGAGGSLCMFQQISRETFVYIPTEYSNNFMPVEGLREFDRVRKCRQDEVLPGQYYRA